LLLQGSFRPTAPLHSYAAAPLHKQIAPFLSRRSIEKSVACPRLTPRQTNLASLPLEIVSGRRAESFQRRQHAKFCRSVTGNQITRPRAGQWVGQYQEPCCKTEVQPRSLRLCPPCRHRRAP